MKNFLFIYGLVLSFASFTFANEPKQTQHSDGTFHFLETSGLAKPLLLIIGPKGFIGCGYINVESCDKTNEACAIVSGVNTTEEIKHAEIKKVSKAALKLGIKVGMKGSDALMFLK